MMLWTAAIRSAGAKANHKLSRARFCSSVRRSSTSTFTAADAAADHHRQISKLVEPSIYLCFRETTKSTHYVVRRMGLNDDASEDLTVEAYKTFENFTLNCRHPHNCTTLGSQFIFHVYSDDESGCRNICWTDTAKRPMKLEVSSVTHYGLEELREQIKSGEFRYISLPEPEIRKMKIGVIGGELYSLDLENKQLFRMYPCYNELFDTFYNRFSILDSRCSLPGGGTAKFEGLHEAVFFNESKKILASSYFGLYCFDASNPKNGWREVSFGFPYYESRRFNRALVVHNYHPEIGHFNLVFTQPENYMRKLGPVEVYFVSNACDYAHAIDHFIELPNLSSQFATYSFLDIQFVYLGAQNFGIVVNISIKRVVLFLTYEYDIIATPAADKSRAEVDIKSRFKGTHVFSYQSIEPNPGFDGIHLVGASYIQQLVHRLS